MTFRSTDVTGTPQSFKITGDLTVKSRTRPVTVHGKVNGDRMLRGWVITRRLEPHTPRSWAYCGWPTRSEWSSE
ncbi:YceI family protein [Streptomyces sp. NPDC056723]|uniref:YceI family protein n=1 Tax=unclassified Streptomyces TaxID=2593676 RepID=UPI0036C5AE93